AGERTESVPIGRPLANTQIYLLNGDMRPVPVGVAGEVYIGGIGLARGYHERPELSAEKFIPDPFSEAPGARLYRTGDQAWYRADGALDFIGRKDHQVKIRGYRIELGEIEAGLRQHPAVREAVVLAREYSPGDNRLVAYYTAASDEPTAPVLSAETLRKHLSELLPDYMVPAAYVALDVLPLGPSGKLDRHALPVPDGEAYAAGGYEAPVGGIEQILAGIWADVLKLEQVGR